MSKYKEHVIILTQGREDGGHAAMLAFKLAVTMQAMQQKNLCFFDPRGNALGISGDRERPHFAR